LCYYFFLGKNATPHFAPLGQRNYGKLREIIWAPPVCAQQKFFKKFAITFHGPVLNALYIGLRADARGQLPFHFAITEPPLSYA
jgi:hypothetical protein